MNKNNSPGVPRSLLVLIVVILGAMYYYAAFVAYTNPEEAVQNFYTAYFERDYQTVAENLSVFWSVQFLPQYGSSSPAQLVASRPAIEKDIVKVISQIEAGNPVPKGMAVTILPEYTKKSPHAAVVVYEFEQNGKPMGMEAAILIKEKYRLLIYNMTPVGTESLDQIKKIDMKELDKSFASLVAQKSV